VDTLKAGEKREKQNPANTTMASPNMVLAPFACNRKKKKKKKLQKERKGKESESFFDTFVVVLFWRGIGTRFRDILFCLCL